MTDPVPFGSTESRMQALRKDAIARDRIDWSDAQEEIDEQDRVMSFGIEERAIVYREKYELFRHFDVQRWQVPGLVFAVGSALFAFAPKMANGLPHFLATATYGLFALAGAYLMQRIRAGLRDNNRVLRRFAVSFGDFGVKPPPGAQSASTWMQLLLSLLGVGSLVMSVVSAL